MEYHLANFDINVPRRDAPSTMDKTQESDGKGMTHGSPGAWRSEYIARGPDQTQNNNESNSAGLRKNGAAVGTRYNTGRPQATDKRAGGNIGSEQGLPRLALFYSSPACWSGTRSGAEVNYIKNRMQKSFRIFGHWEVRASSGRNKDQKPAYPTSFGSESLGRGSSAMILLLIRAYLQVGHTTP